MIAHATGLISLGGIFTITLFIANAFLRDKESGMTAIVYCTPISKLQFIATRFLGSYAAAFFIQIFASIGIFLANFSPNIQSDKLGDIDSLYYVWPLIILSGVNLLFCSAIVFLIASMVKNRIAVYVAGILVYILYIVGSIFSNAPWLANASPATSAAMSLAAILDPFGLAAFYEQTNYWTPQEKNTSLLLLSGNFLLNRLIWLLISMLLLALAYKLFSFQTKNKASKTQVDSEIASPSVPYTSVGTNPKKTRWLAIFSLLKIEFSTIIKSLPFLVIILFWLFVLGIEAWAMVDGGVRTPPYYPTTGRMISNLKEVISFLGIIVIVFYANEQLWRNDQLKVSPMLDASPTSNFSFFIAKYMVLCLIPIALIMSGVFVCIILQVLFGYFKFEPLTYLSIFYYAGMPLFLVAALALFLQSIIPNKYAAMAITAIAFAITNPAISGLFGIRHQLFQFASPMTGIDYSDLNGFGHYATAFHWRMLYWSGFAGICMFLTYRLWRRGREHNIVIRLKSLIRETKALGFVLTTLCCIAFFASGGYIFYHTNIQQEYATRDDNRQWRHDYEKQYKMIDNENLPIITSVKTTIDLYPSKQQYQVKGTYQIQNKGHEPISNTVIGISRQIKIDSLVISSAQLKEIDHRFNQFWFDFDTPLQSGEKRTVDFTFHFEWDGFTGHTPFNAVIENGSFMRISRYFPYFGYDAGNELSNPDVRKEYQLPPQEGMAKLVDYTIDSTYSFDYEFIDFEAIVSTDASQTALVSGDLIRQWSSDKRNYFHYKMDRPISFRFAVSSAKYEKKIVNHNGVEITIYYHPVHDYNIDLFLEAAKKSLNYCIQNFGPYPYRQLRLVQISNFTRGFGATAYPNTIYIREDMGFISDHRKSRDIDLITQLMAHEISHQWWGGQIDPQTMEGGITLTESLAQYTELMVYEKQYGKKHVVDALNVELDLYLGGRGLHDDHALYKANGQQPFIPYSKGAKILYAIKSLIGEQKLNKALQRMLQDFAFPKRPPTTYDLLRQLYKVTPTKDHKLIDDWMKKIVIYDLKMQSAGIEELADGKFKVNLQIEISRKADNGLGELIDVPIDETFEVGLFSGDQHGIYNDENIVYLKKHHFNRRNSQLSIVVSQKPDLAGIDPYVISIDSHRTNNLTKISSTPTQ